MTILEEIDEFLSRPRGGLEVEMLYSCIELGTGITLLFDPEALITTPSMLVLYWIIPHYGVGFIFIFSALLTIIGLVVYRAGNNLCIWLRFFGALFSWCIWAWIFLMHLLVIGFAVNPLVTYLSLGGAIWQFRVMVGAQRRSISYRRLGHG